MIGIGRDVRAEVADHSQRIASYAIFRRLKAIVDAWGRDERSKAWVAISALAGLAVLCVATALAVLWQPAYWVALLVIGFVVWVAALVLLMRRYLGRVD